MALKPCRECGQQVSTEAEVCPHCGVRVPTAADPVAALSVSGGKQDKSRGCLPVIGVLIVIVVALVAVGSVNSPNKTAPSCVSDWTKCSDNADLVNNYKDWRDAKYACKMQANEQAKYGTPVWSWSPFGTYYRGNEYVTSGEAVAIEPDAQFQNGFGAMVHSQVTCTYDLRAKRVISVDILAR
jgi:hypothetical protein